MRIFSHRSKLVKTTTIEFACSRRFIMDITYTQSSSHNQLTTCVKYTPSSSSSTNCSTTTSRYPQTLSLLFATKGIILSTSTSLKTLRLTYPQTHTQTMSHHLNRPHIFTYTQIHKHSNTKTTSFIKYWNTILINKYETRKQGNVGNNLRMARAISYQSYN